MAHPKFSIRPAPKPGESLSSYLLRVSIANDIEVLDLMRAFSKDGKLMRYRSHLLDTLPPLAANLGQLSRWVIKTESCLENMSFLPVVKKFYSDEEINNFKGVTSKIITRCIITDRRRFCSQCLHEGRGYQLIWQVAELKFCNIHLTKLTDRCTLCYTEQQYKLNDKTYHYMCDRNTHDLRKQSQESAEVEELNNELRKYEDWLFLLNPYLSLVPIIEGLNQDQSLAAALLYITQVDKRRFTTKNSILSQFDVYNFRKIISQPQDTVLKVHLERLLSIVRKVGISLKNFSQLNVSVDYVVSIKESTGSKQAVCLAPWCVSYLNDKTMIKVKHNPRVSDKGVIYNGHTVCVNCWMRYGYDNKDNTWSPVGNFMKLIQRTIEIINPKHSKYEISRRLKTSKTTVTKIYGYMIQYGLLPSELKLKYTPPAFKGDLVKCFQELVHEEGGNGLMVKSSKLMGWDVQTYYYYLADAKVQRYLIFDAHTDRTRYQSATEKFRIHDKNQVIGAFEDVVQAFLAKDRTISLKTLSNELSVSSRSLYLYGLGPRISEVIKEQRSQRKRALEDQLWESADAYLGEKENRDEPVQVKEVVAYLGLSSSSWMLTYPTLNGKISARVFFLKEKRKAKKIEEYKVKVDDLFQVYNSATNSLIAEYLGETYKNLFATYPEVLLHVQQIRECSNKIK